LQEKNRPLYEPLQPERSIKTQRRETRQKQTQRDRKKITLRFNHYKKEKDLYTNHCSLKEVSKHKEERQQRNKHTETESKKDY
jgi:hypothetical protein